MATSNRGGARKGTGPKTGPGGKRIKKNTCLTADVWVFWCRNGQTASAEIEESTRKSSTFRRFLKDRHNGEGEE